MAASALDQMLRRRPRRLNGDSLVPVRNSLDLLAALAAHGVPFESHIYLLGPHGISLAKPLTAGTAAAIVNASVAHWLPESVRFLQDHRCWPAKSTAP